MDKDATTWLIIAGLVLVGIFFLTQKNGFGFGGGGNGDGETYSPPPDSGIGTIKEFTRLGNPTYA